MQTTTKERNVMWTAEETMKSVIMIFITLQHARLSLTAFLVAFFGGDILVQEEYS